MNSELIEELRELMAIFPRSYINQNFELILIPKTNTYFGLEGVSSRRDIIAKLFMYCSRDISNSIPYKSATRNNLFQEVVRKNLNYYIGTIFSQSDIDLIYQKLGNGIRPELTYKFIDSGFDLEVLHGTN